MYVSLYNPMSDKNVSYQEWICVSQWYKIVVVVFAEKDRRRLFQDFWWGANRFKHKEMQFHKLSNYKVVCILFLEQWEISENMYFFFLFFKLQHLLIF